MFIAAMVSLADGGQALFTARNPTDEPRVRLASHACLRDSQRFFRKIFPSN